jgi:hypothetical protein
MKPDSLHPLQVENKELKRKLDRYTRMSESGETFGDILDMKEELAECQQKLLESQARETRLLEGAKLHGDLGCRGCQTDFLTRFAALREAIAQAKREVLEGVAQWMESFDAGQSQVTMLTELPIGVELYSRPLPPAVPKGWKMVPIEPTREEGFTRWFGLHKAGGNTTVEIGEISDGSIAVGIITERADMEPLITKMRLSPDTFSLLSEALFCAAHDPSVWRKCTESLT